MVVLTKVRAYLLGALTLMGLFIDAICLSSHMVFPDIAESETFWPRVKHVEIMY